MKKTTHHLIAEVPQSVHGRVDDRHWSWGCLEPFTVPSTKTVRSLIEGSTWQRCRLEISRVRQGQPSLSLFMDEDVLCFVSARQAPCCRRTACTILALC